MLRTCLHILIIWAAGLATAGSYAKVSVWYADVAALYPTAGAWLPATVSALGLFGVVFGVVAGRLVAGWGYRRVLILGLIVTGLCAVGEAFFPPFALFLALRLVEGAAHLGIVIAGPTLMAQIAPPRWRGAALTLWSSFFAVAFAVTALAGTRLSLPAMFWAHAAICVALAGALLWVPKARPDTPSPAGSYVAQHRAVYRSAVLSAPAVGWLFYTLCFVSLVTLWPGTLPPAQSAFAAGAMPLVGLATSLTLGAAVLTRGRAFPVVVFGFGVSGLFALILAAVPSSLGLLFAVFAVLGLVQASSFALVPELAENASDQAAANGAMAQMGNLGNLLGTPLLALLATPRFMALATAALLLSGALCHLALRRKRSSAKLQHL